MKRKTDDIAEIVSRPRRRPGAAQRRAGDRARGEVLAAARHCATVQLGTAGARAFTDDKLRDESIAKLRERVRLRLPDLKPAPNDRPPRDDALR